MLSVDTLRDHLAAAFCCPEPEVGAYLAALRTRGALPPDVRFAVEAAISDADPAADVVFTLVCPACAVAWTAPLDLAGFVWEEVEHAAHQIMTDVDVLARAYGWREPDVLALSPWRRHCYLGLAQG